jgi:hypothetical protein
LFCVLGVVLQTILDVYMYYIYLKKINFTFNGDHYLQMNGSIIMGKFEKQLLESSIERQISWYRFIKEVEMKWTQGDEEL